MPFIQWNDMIKQFAAQGTDCPFTDPILPWGMEAGAERLNLGMSQKFLKIFTGENAVVVVQQIFRFNLKRSSFPDLVDDPGGSWVGGYRDMFNFAAVMTDDQQDIKEL